MQTESTRPRLRAQGEVLGSLGVVGVVGVVGVLGVLGVVGVVGVVGVRASKGQIPFGEWVEGRMALTENFFFFFLFFFVFFPEVDSWPCPRPWIMMCPRR